MTINEKVSYIKGLADGLGLDENNKQDKILKAIIDVLEDVALSIEELDDTCAEMGEQIDAVDEDLANLEDDFYEDECDCDCDDEDCDCCCEDDEFEYEIECPNCHDCIYLTEDMIEEGEINCPGCGTNLEFDFDCDCDCDGGCDCCGNEE